MLMATMLADMPDLRMRIQAQHIPTQNGTCADCRDDTRWPCEVYRIAAEAERRGGSTLPWSAPTHAWSATAAGSYPSSAPTTPSFTTPSYLR